MKMKKTDKEKIVADLHQRLSRSQAVFVTDFTGLNVESINKLRRDLKQRGDQYRVVKKTLLRRASQETPVSAIEDILMGPCGIPSVTGFGGFGQIIGGLRQGPGEVCL